MHEKTCDPHIMKRCVIKGTGLYIVYFNSLDHDQQGLHRLEKYLNSEGFLEKSLKIKSTLKSSGKSLKGLEKSLNSYIFCRT